MNEQWTGDWAAPLLLGKLAEGDTARAVAIACASPENVGIFLKAFSTLLFENLRVPDRNQEKKATLREFHRYLKRCDRVHGVLQGLLAAGQDYHFSAIRYYWSDAEGRRLVSANSAGHTSDLAERIQTGEFDKHQNKSPLHESDSFWSFALKRPVIIRVDGNSSTRLRELPGPSGIPLLVVDREPCQFLEGHKGHMWVDFPLQVGEKWTGKLSCDYEGKLEDGSKVSDDVSGFWRFVQSTAPRLEALYLKETLGPITEAQMETRQCNSLEELNRYCVERLPQVFGGGTASLYMLSEDDLGSAFLVLRKTSEPRKQGQEDLERHQLQDPHFVAWVARERLSIVVSSPSGIPETDRPRAVEDSDEAIAQALRDEYPHSTVMAVPIVASAGRGKSIGVYTIVRPSAEGTCRRLTDADPALLEMIANECLGPKLESLPYQMFRENMFNYLKCTKEMSVSDCWTFSALPEALGRAMERVLPGNDRTEKCYLLGLLDEDHRTFRYHRVGGTLETAPRLAERLPLQPSVMERALEHDTFFIANLMDLGPGEALCQMAKKAVCVLIARITFREIPYGALVVLSDHYDFLPQWHGLVLKLFADEMGEIFARRKILGNTFKGLQQGIVQALEQMSRYVDGGNHGESAGGSRREIAGPIQFVRHLLSGSADLVQFGRLPETHRPLNVHDAISKILEIFQAGDNPFGNVRNEVDRRLKADVQEDYLVLIIYSLLSAWRASSPEGVEIHGSVSNRTLNLRLEGKRGRRIFVCEEESGEWQLSDAFLHLGFVRPDKSFLLLARRLAERHQTADGRCGHLQVRKPRSQGGDQFFISLPLAAGANG